MNLTVHCLRAPTLNVHRTSNDAHARALQSIAKRSILACVRAKTDAISMRSLKKRARWSQICIGTMRTRRPLQAPVALRDLPTAHAHGKRGDSKRARGKAHLATSLLKALIATVREGSVETKRPLPLLLNSAASFGRRRQLKSETRRWCTCEQANAQL